MKRFAGLRPFAPLILSAMCILVVYAWFSRRSYPDGDPIDPYIVGGIGATLLIVAILMLALSRSWTVRGVGVLYIISAVVVSTLGGLAIQEGYLDAAHIGILLNVQRALLIVGGPMLLYGALCLIVEWWRCRREPRCDTGDLDDGSSW